MAWIENTNRKIAASAVGRWFQLEGSGHVSQLLYHHAIPVKRLQRC